MKVPRYIQIEPSFVLSNPALCSLTAAQFGCYCRLILYLYANDGKIDNDIRILARITRCGKHFEGIWNKISFLFYQEEGFIKNSSVDEQLQRITEISKAAYENGLKGSEARWSEQKQEKPSEPAQTNETEYVVCYDKLIKIIPPRSRSDYSCFRNLAVWLKSQVKIGQFNDQVYERVLDLAKEAAGAVRPAAAFMSLVKKELDYGNVPTDN